MTTAHVNYLGAVQQGEVGRGETGAGWRRDGPEGGGKKEGKRKEGRHGMDRRTLRYTFTPTAAGHPHCRGTPPLQHNLQVTPIKRRLILIWDRSATQHFHLTSIRLTSVICYFNPGRTPSHLLL